MEWLERLRDLKNMTSETYKSISQKTGIPQTTIEKLFSGRTKDPKLNMMRAIVHCLGFTLDDLVEGDDNCPDKFILNENEQFLIQNFRSLSEQGKKYILQTIDIAVNTYKKDETFKYNKSSISEDIAKDFKKIIDSKINTKSE